MMDIDEELARRERSKIEAKRAAAAATRRHR